MTTQTPPLNGQDINLAARAVRDLLDVLLERADLTFEQSLVMQALGPESDGLERTALVTDLADRLRGRARVTRLARAHYYDGLSFHRYVPKFVIQGGSPGANEQVGDAAFMRDELGGHSHLRGTVGISTRGHDTGDAQFFINLVDNKRLDHDYTVFGEVVSGLDVVDRIRAGDIMQRVEVIPGTFHH